MGRGFGSGRGSPDWSRNLAVGEATTSATWQQQILSFRGRRHAPACPWIRKIWGPFHFKFLEVSPTGRRFLWQGGTLCVCSTATDLKTLNRTDLQSYRSILPGLGQKSSDEKIIESEITWPLQPVSSVFLVWSRRSTWHLSISRRFVVLNSYTTSGKFCPANKCQLLKFAPSVPQR